MSRLRSPLMHVAAALQPAKLARLQQAAGNLHRVHPALDWPHIEAIVRRQTVDVLVVDPQFDTGDEPGTHRIRAVRQRYRSLPMIVYSDLTARTLRPLAELGREGLEELVLFGLDDDPRHLRRMLDRQPGIALSQRLLGRLREPLARTPEPVAASVERLIRNPAAFRDVPDLAAAAGVPRRSLYRHLERAGLASPRELLAGSRLLRAYAFLREPSYSLDAVASHVRFSDTDAMSRTMKWSVGTTPARARGRMGPDEFLDRLANRLAPALTVPDQVAAGLALAEGNGI